MIKEELKQIKESPEDLKKFGLTIGAVLVIIAIVLYLYGKQSYFYFLAPGLLLASIGLAIPEMLKPLNKVWMIIAILLGWVMTRVILTILFYLVITPTGLIARLVGKDFLKLRKIKSETYWEKREPKTPVKVDYERQF
ncbi:MAG: hypothetical protein K8H86_02745 [Ignavibacteriaceae bacterium]|nr:hypothetical protein [Ignavibacteriaceae bacterium]